MPDHTRGAALGAAAGTLATAQIAFAQGADPVVPGTPAGNGTPIEGTAPAGGAPGQAAPGPGGGSFLLFLLPVLLIFMLFMSSRAQKKERRKTQDMLGSLRRGDRVQTVGGVIGRIAEIRDSEVVLKVDEQAGIKMRFAKSAVQKVLAAGAEPKSEHEELAEAETSA